MAVSAGDGVETEPELGGGLYCLRGALIFGRSQYRGSTIRPTDNTYPISTVIENPCIAGLFHSQPFLVFPPLPLQRGNPSNTTHLYLQRNFIPFIQRVFFFNLYFVYNIKDFEQFKCLFIVETIFCLQIISVQV